jgi:hypothetical protein
VEVMKLENREQMIQVANNCIDFENMVSFSVKNCSDCINFGEGICIKDMFEVTLIALD